MLFNLYSLKENEGGSDIYSALKRLEKLDLFLSADKKKDAIQERNNLTSTLLNIFNLTNLKGLQLGCFIYSINDVKIDDYSESNIKEILTKLSKEGVTQKQVSDIVDEIKNDILNELRVCFPDKFSNSLEITYCINLLDKLKKQIEFVLTEDETKVDGIKKINEFILDFFTPKNLSVNDKNNDFVRQSIDFENLCVTLMRNGIANPKQLSTFSFYVMLKNFEKKK